MSEVLKKTILLCARQLKSMRRRTEDGRRTLPEDTSHRGFLLRSTRTS